MDLEWLIRNALVLSCLGFLLYLTFKKTQNESQNWAMFYASIWILLSLPIVNGLCVKLGYWHYRDQETLAIGIPVDLLFAWLLIWGVVIPYYFKGKYMAIVCTTLLWLDLLLMPLLVRLDMIVLNNNWLIGEVLMIAAVCAPSYLWAKLSFEKKGLPLRIIFQFLCMAMLFFLVIPYALFVNFPDEKGDPMIAVQYIMQLLIIISLPSLIALVDMYEKGEGTPFPYDPTKQLVRTGVYAYIRNPIQWSLTLVFIPLALYYGTYYLLSGMVVTIAYTVGISNQQEHLSMEQRFGEDWVSYKRSVPAWYLLWKPTDIPGGQIFFKGDCKPCAQIANWFKRRDTVHLAVKDITAHPDGNTLIQVTYVDHMGRSCQSVKAIASAFEHINLAWASLAWLMRLPVISHVLQIIVNGMGLMDKGDVCVMSE